MTDQEGGEVRRLPGAPELAPAAMNSTAVAYAQGAATGRLLRSVGVNVDLAPVADVERASNSFLGTRSFGSDPAVVAARACAFARGLGSAGVAYTLKHFPGLGSADANTDVKRVEIPLPAAQLRADYAAYHACGSSPDAMIMISSAIYPSLTRSAPAVLSPRIYAHELPIALGHSGQLTISDALDTPGLAAQSHRRCGRSVRASTSSFSRATCGNRRPPTGSSCPARAAGCSRRAVCGQPCTRSRRSSVACGRKRQSFSFRAL
jgi:beta-N-acetylhexosaminidase